MVEARQVGWHVRGQNSMFGVMIVCPVGSPAAQILEKFALMTIEEMAQNQPVQVSKLE